MSVCNSYKPSGWFISIELGLVRGNNIYTAWLFLKLFTELQVMREVASSRNVNLMASHNLINYKGSNFLHYYYRYLVKQISQ